MIFLVRALPGWDIMVAMLQILRDSITKMAFHAQTCARKIASHGVLRLLGLLLALSACFRSPEAIRDIHNLPQNSTFYLDENASNRVVLSPLHQELLDAEFNQIRFAPWRRAHPLHSKDELAAKLEKYRNDPGYGENKRRHERAWIDRLTYLAQPDFYPNAGFPAITLAPSALRELPTHKPHFHSFGQAGEGYPFDNLQIASIAPNTPVFISHISRDGSWVLTESHYGLGWLETRDVAAVDEELIKDWEGGSHVAVIKDDVPITAENGLFLFNAPLGLPLPIEGEDPDGYTVRVATTDADRRAVPRRAWIGKESAVRKPMKLTAGNVARLANEFISQIYGWGGAYGNRDCSATLKDLFAPFGLMLPRNSAHQATDTGTFISLSHLSPSEKEEAVLQDGIPYFTLLWYRGHIMLYIGSFRGQPVVFHNFWGIKTQDLLGREGRKVVGHAAITTLHPGAELPDIDRPHGDFLNRLEGMTLLVPRHRNP
jgi:hypothetical protein